MTLWLLAVGVGRAFLPTSDKIQDCTALVKSFLGFLWKPCQHADDCVTTRNESARTSKSNRCSKNDPAHTYPHPCGQLQLSTPCGQTCG